MLHATCVCGREFVVSSSLAGRRCRCPQCGGVVLVPVVESSPPEAAPADANSIIIVCSSCGKRYLGGRHLVGKQIHCPACGSITTVPGSAGAPTIAMGPPVGDPWMSGELAAREAADSLPLNDDLLAAAGPPLAPPVLRTFGLPRRARRRLAWILGLPAAVLVLLLLIAMGRMFWDSTFWPEWKPDSNLLAELGAEEVVGAYAIRPVAGLDRQEERRHAEEKRWVHSWIGRQPPCVNVVVYEHHISHTLSGGVSSLASRAAKWTRVPPGPIDFDSGRIGDLQFVRGSYCFDTQSMYFLDDVVACRYNRIWTCFDGERQIFILVASESPFESREFELVEASVRTFRRGEGAVESPTATVEGWTPDISAASLPREPIDLPPLPAPSSAGVIAGRDLQSDLVIPFGLGRVVFAPGLSTYVATDTGVYRLTDGVRVGAIPKEILDSPDFLKLSPDGRLFAHRERDTINVYSTDGGKQVAQRKFSHSSTFKFLDGSRLWVVDGGKAAVWDVTSGDVVAESLAGTVSPGGKYLASCDWSGVRIGDLLTGRPVATPESPQGEPSLSACKELFFSPDGQELTAVLGGRVVVWSSKGNLVEDFRLPGNRWNSEDARPGLQSIPGNRGWLISGEYLLERQSKRVVAHFAPPKDGLVQHRRLDSGRLYHWLDPGRLLVARSQSREQNELVAVSIPWRQIGESLRAAESGRCYLAPGQRISLAVDVGEVRHATRTDVIDKLTKALRDAVSINDITIAPDQPIVLHVAYREFSGGTEAYVRSFLTMVDPNSPPQRVEVTEAELVLTLREGQEGQTLWERRLRGTPPASLHPPATAENLRNGMFEALLESIDDRAIPGLIPRESSLWSLPIVIALGSDEL